VSPSRVVDHPDPATRAAQGRAARAAVPRSRHGEWDPPTTRPSPVRVLQEQAKSRVPELVPIRHARMTASPFERDFETVGAAVANGVLEAHEDAPR